MKKIYVMAGLAATLTLGTTACSDFLDKEPSTALPTEEAVTSVRDLENAVNGVAYYLTYNRMSYPSEFGLYADFTSGNFAIIKDNNQSSELTRYQSTQNSSLPDVGYEIFYKALAQVNMALSNIDKIDATEKEKATVDDFHGQLLAWRGLLHFDLARMFCHIPSTVSDLNAANTGLVLSTQVYEPTYLGTRSTLKETYDQIVKDLSDAMPLLSKEKNTGYINYWAALGLRARAYLYLGKYAEALADAKEVMADSPYTLYTIAEYPNVWTQEGSNEAIFEMLTTDNYNVQRNSLGYYTEASGYAECGFNTDSKLYKYLSTTPDDVRSQLIKDETTTDMTGKASKAPGYYPNKYPGRNGSIYVNNPKIIRLSEIYLIAAEAAYYISGGAEAAKYINSLRQQRITDYKAVASVTLDEILFEYEVELFAENQISFAYWRNKKSVYPTAIPEKEMKYNDDRTILPLPKRELDLNTNLEQNPGYSR